MCENGIRTTLRQMLGNTAQHSAGVSYLLALREVYWPQLAPAGYSRIRWMSGSSTTLPATSETRGAGHENQVEANVSVWHAWMAGGGASQL